MATKTRKGRPGGSRGGKIAASHAAEQRTGPDLADQGVVRRSMRVALLGPMAAGIAHDFNNLLTVVLGSLEQLQRQPLTPQGQEQLRRAEWGVQQAGKLAQQILSLVRPTNRVAAPVDLNVAVSGVQEMLRLTAGKNIQLIVETAAEVLPVKLDPGLLGLALLNLVRNAADAMEGEGTITIATSQADAEQGVIEVAVVDTGPGMPGSVLERATDCFFTTKRPGHGTGLGLWMVQRFITGCGGKLSIDTTAGRGTTVRLLLPRADDALPVHVTEQN